METDCPQREVYVNRNAWKECVVDNVMKKKASVGTAVAAGVYPEA